MNTLERINDELRDYAAAFDPSTYSGPDAAHLTEIGARGKRIYETIELLFAKRAVDTNGWRRDSHAASPEQWLANATGASEHTARETLRVADRLAELPATEDKLRSGDLSLVQAQHVTRAAALDPAAETRLLRVAERSGVRELREDSERVITAVSDEARLVAQARDERPLAGWTRGLATHGSFSGPTEDVAELFDAIEPLARHAFEAARAAGKHEPVAAYRFDALIALARGAEIPATGSRREPVARACVGLSRLLGQEPEPGEKMCEIPGVGPVPVAHAREVLAHGLFELVISDGVDVRTVVSTTRHIPKALRIALEHRDQGRCKVRCCDHTRAIQRHHTELFSESRRTAYEILGDACPDHHRLIHHKGHEVIDNGTWTLRAPPHTSAA